MHTPQLLSDSLLPKLNLFAYGQVMGGYGRLFIETLSKIEDEQLVSAKIGGKDDIYVTIKTFLGKGN